MDSLLISAASGMRARMQSLDMLANNIANTGTAGFKADREFYNLYEHELPLVESQWTDFSQGSLTVTGSPLTAALSGPGFFALNGPTGTVYTRDGNFRVSKTNQLVSPEGYPVRNVLDQGRPITVDPLQSIGIDKTGVVTQGGQPLGQMEVDQIPSAASALTKLGNTYFAIVSKNISATPVPDTEVLQGQIEQSNVPVTDAAVHLISVMRQFEMLQKAMNVGTEMNKSAIQEVAKVS